MASYQSNPVGALQEKFQSKSKSSRPQYKVVRAEGAAHAPTFSYQVILGDLATIGRGSSKKQAKDAAARAMLDKLDTMKVTTVDTQAPFPPQEKMKVEVGNTVGALQEFCVKQAYPFPSYESGVKSDQGDFSVACCVGKLREVGVGDNKKDAKKNAAGKMITKLGCLMGISSSSVPIVNVVKSETPVVQLSKRLSAHSIEETEKVNNIREEKDQEEEIASRQVGRNRQLQKDESKSVAVKNIEVSKAVNYIELLTKFGERHKFVVTSVEVKDNCEDSVKCLVQLGTVPVVVSYAVGVDKTSAFNEASKSSLIYMKRLSDQISQVGKKLPIKSHEQNNKAERPDSGANLGQGCVTTLGQSRRQQRGIGGPPMFPPHVGGSRIEIS